MSPSHIHGLTGILCSSAASLALTACLGSTEPLQTVKWQADLVGVAGQADAVSGSVAMVIGERQTQIGISVRDAPSEAALGWTVREGTCRAPGDRVGPASTYPAIAVSAAGEGESETVLFRRIGTAGPYAGFVFAEPDGSGPVLACADLERLD